MRHRVEKLAICFALLCTLPGCTPSGVPAAPAIEAADSIVLGEPLAVRAVGLEPGALYTLGVETRDSLSRQWVAQAQYRADPTGQLATATDAPVEADYEAVDPYGLLWSAEMAERLEEGWEPPEPADHNELRISLGRDGVELASAVVRQWLRPPGVQCEGVGGGLVAELCLPPAGSEGSLPGLVLLGGSGGGMGWASRTAALLANEGYAALALAYFKGEGLPEHLARVPIEPVFAALERLAAEPRVDGERLGLIGYSKGAELALVVASRRPEVRAVVAIAPGSAVFQGFEPPRYPTISSWTLAGRELPFVPNAYDKRFFETFDGMYLWYRTLRQHEALAEAAIPVEQIGGDLLLLSGVEDTIWPATYMAEQLVARLYLAEFEHQVRHLAFPRAGHGIAAPPGEATTGVAARLGGTAGGNAAAREQGWRAIVEFLASALS